MLSAWAGQQPRAGLDPGAISTRLEYLSIFRVSVQDPLAALENVTSHEVKTGLRRRKGNLGGPKRKALVSLSVLQEIFDIRLDKKTKPAMRIRHMKYLVLWWLLIVSGCRPHELCGATLVLGNTSVKIKYLHRKSNATPGARPDEMPNSNFRQLKAIFWGRKLTDQR
jgi:hypothetical protein